MSSSKKRVVRRSRSKKLGRPKDHNKYKAERRCSKQKTKKYTSRPGPPFPANLCRGSVKKGNDKKMYKSTRARSSGKVYYKWSKVKTPSKRKRFGVRLIPGF